MYAGSLYGVNHSGRALQAPRDAPKQELTPEEEVEKADKELKELLEQNKLSDGRWAEKVRVAWLEKGFRMEVDELGNDAITEHYVDMLEFLSNPDLALEGRGEAVRNAKLKVLQRECMAEDLEDPDALYQRFLDLCEPLPEYAVQRAKEDGGDQDLFFLTIEELYMYAALGLASHVEIETWPQYFGETALAAIKQKYGAQNEEVEWQKNFPAKFLKDMGQAVEDVNGEAMQDACQMLVEDFRQRHLRGRLDFWAAIFAGAVMERFSQHHFGVSAVGLDES